MPPKDAATRSAASPPPLSSSLTSAGSSMVYALMLFVVTLSAQQVNAATLASSEWFTILGGFVSSLLFLFALTFFGNVQEYIGVRTGWGAVLLSLAIATLAAASVHRVCATTCILFSLVILYEVNSISNAYFPSLDAKKKAS